MAENFGTKVGFQPETLGFLVHPCWVGAHFLCADE